MQRRIDITIETDRLLVAGGHKRLPTVWCAPCRKHVELMTSDDAAILSRVNSRTIFHWVESGRVHYTETSAGLLLICPDSLPLNNQKENA